MKQQHRIEFFFVLTFIVVDGFAVLPSFRSVGDDLVCGSLTSLLAKGSRKAFQELEGEGAVTPSSRASKPETVKRTKPSKQAKNGVVEVSPLLADWAAKTDQDQDFSKTESSYYSTGEDDDDSSANSFGSSSPPKKRSSSSNSRRIRQSERMRQDKEQEAKIATLIEGLEEILEKEKGSVAPIVSQVRKLMDSASPSSSLRQLTASSKKLTYRLAWVGSDEALCHVGTGLHKVPLARMQEVFLTFEGKNRLELLEVISILGPFPNVRNTLQGACDGISAGDSFTQWTIEMDSMVDGTGKEILAGTKVRSVPLHVYFADISALIAVVPNENGEARDPLSEDGKNVLVFVKEEELDEKLAKNRVL